jgi:hypothetical protein
MCLLWFSFVVEVVSRSLTFSEKCGAKFPKIFRKSKNLSWGVRCQIGNSKCAEECAVGVFCERLTVSCTAIPDSGAARLLLQEEEKASWLENFGRSYVHAACLSRI